ncbi:histone-fold-containing protein [Truncatella angustata]|uniref:Histone-fold-containing protein n=1 Tax=Truncatella angustata TaxID=152316 RepID=A0A9P9A4Z4_9PEZI|nr:histone-fold-containing protein [Truncatella angustata]KAH6660379.1 histone-fold-containing protein [Truncatella angustata]
MPYNTTAIPPRKEVTGQTQLPLSRVKKIIAQDQDVQICSNNASFAITVATEMFIQHLAAKALDQAKAERKPRRNIQYKDIANAVHGHDNLEFLEDLVPKTVKFKDVKATAAATRASLRGGRSADDAEDEEPRAPAPNGTKKHKSSASRSSLNGSVDIGSMLGNGRGANGTEPRRQSDAEDNSADPNDQLEMEMRQARGNDGDVEMAD